MREEQDGGFLYGQGEFGRIRTAVCGALGASPAALVRVRPGTGGENSLYCGSVPQRSRARKFYQRRNRPAVSRRLGIRRDERPDVGSGGRLYRMRIRGRGRRALTDPLFRGCSTVGGARQVWRHKVYVDFLWSLWGKVRAKGGTDVEEEEFEAYAQARYARVKQHLESLNRLLGAM